MPNERHYNELNLESVGINLPYNMQAEQSVLGAVLLKPETLTDLVEIIRPEMFYTRQNAQIYSEMLRLFTSDQTIDFVTLLDAVISDGVPPSADEAKVYLTGLAETVPDHLQDDQRFPFPLFEGARDIVDRFPVLGDKALRKGIAAALGPAKLPGQAHHGVLQFRKFGENAGLMLLRAALVLALLFALANTFPG